MSIQAVDWALRQRISAPQKLVLVALANHADAVTGRCWPKIATIAAEASMSPRSVHTHLGALMADGFISIEGSRGVKTGRPNTYVVNFPRNVTARRPPELQPSCSPGSATACRPQNRHQNRHYKTELPSTRAGMSADEIKSSSQNRVGSDQGGIQVELARRFGPTVEAGFEVVFALSPSRLDELCAMQRQGTLEDRVVQQLAQEHRGFTIRRG